MNIEGNLRRWNQREWTNKGEEWSCFYGSSQAQWNYSIRPRIEKFIPTDTILEIAPGYGRWTHYLKEECQKLIGVDLSPKCIKYCKKRFASYPNMEFHINDGKSLKMISNNSIDFIFCFDSLVHASPNVIMSYLKEISNKLNIDGVGLIHHSNLGTYKNYPFIKRITPSLLRKLSTMTERLINFGSKRNTKMTAKLFEKQCKLVGLKCVSQEIINWGGYLLIDCISIFTTKKSKWSQENKIKKNRKFMKEARKIRRSNFFNNIKN